MLEIELRAIMCDAGRRLWQKGHVVASEGNLSCRLSPQRLLFTPSGMSKGHLKPNDLVITDMHGSVIGKGKVSSEYLMHLEVYRQRPDCQAVVHAHPLHATALAIAGESIPDLLTPEAVDVLGSVALAPFAMPGTLEVPASIQPLLPDHRAILLSHHGALCLGKSIEDALFRMETLERCAELTFKVKQLGGIAKIPGAARRALEIKLQDPSL